MTKFFLAGIIQGSIHGDDIHSQDYRERIKEIICQSIPDADVYCPIENHPNSLRYDDGYAREVFLGHIDQGAEADVLVAFLPEASMGTAVEMWEAWKSGRVVISVTPMGLNWTVKFLSTRICETLEEFEEFVSGGELSALLRSREEDGE